MNFKQYQEVSRKTAKYPDLGKNYIYPTLGLSGESGEVCEKIKKLIRDRDGCYDDEWKEDIKKELGDCIWYIAQLCTEFGICMDDVAETNIKKLLDRMARNVIKGDGDNR